LSQLDEHYEPSDKQHQIRAGFTVNRAYFQAGILEYFHTDAKCRDKRNYQAMQPNQKIQV
jgi:hypothetical protein